MNIRHKIAEIITEHVMADDQLPTADAIIKALPHMVQDLVWYDLNDKWGTVTCGKIQITRRGSSPSWNMSCSSPETDLIYHTLEDAKSAANAHHCATVMAAFGIQQD